MCRPLNEKIAELEAKYKGYELECTLEERFYGIVSYQTSMENLLMLMNHYSYEVKYTLEHKLSITMISRMTQDLLIHITHTHDYMLPYHYFLQGYLMDVRYDENHRYWLDFENESQEILNLIKGLRDNNIFEIEGDSIDEFHNDVHIKQGFGGEIPSSVRDVAQLSCMSGAGLLACLEYMLGFMRQKLTSIKNCGQPIDESLAENLFDLNYLLYAKRYWPEELKRFRPHISNRVLKNNVTINGLQKLRDDAIHEFEYHTEFGKMWRDYSETPDLLAREMRNNIKKNNDWKNFFLELFKIDEFDRWIEELRNPPESEEDKQKRERLLKSNKVFSLQPTTSKYDVDILLLYVFIRDRFITEKMFIYEWYALYYILRRAGVLTNCTTEDFVKQMNDKEWFADVDKKCSANEINTYGFLTDKSPDVWSIKYKPQGTNKASKKAIDNIYRKYSDLEDTIDEIYIKE